METKIARELLSDAIASTTELGMVKPDNKTISVDANGVISVINYQQNTVINTPSITSPSNNSTSVINLDGITVNTSVFSSKESDTQSQLKVKITSDLSGNAILAEKTVSGSSNTCTFTPADLTNLNNGTVYIWVAQVGNTYGQSNWSNPVNITVAKASVTTPTVITPVSNAEIVVSSGVTIGLSPFAITGGGSSTDTQASASYKITSDSAGNTIVSQSLNNTTDLQSHTFASSELSSMVENTTYYALGKQTGTNTGDSAWSSSVPFRIKSGISTASGRTIYRHSNNKGSVIVLDMFGTTVNLFVADAQYRKREDTKFGAYNKDSSLNNFSTYYSGTGNFYSGGDTTSGATYQDGATSGTNVGSYASLPALTDAQLQSRLSPLSSDLTARANCDVWMTYQGTTDSQSITGVPAVEWCRSLTSFDGITGGCDVPNLYELSVLYIEGDYIDALDPTLTSYPNNALGKSTNSYRWFNKGYAWSSTEYSSTNVFRLLYIGLVRDSNKYSAFSVVPVREL